MSIGERLANQQARINFLYKKLDELEVKVKQLEQQQIYYPFSEEELLREKIGGTD